jgi:AcrR family transcriptional regulator
MDRRQRKTREAIFIAFSELLAKKSYNRISVQEIIDLADVGRTTFYEHFETKEFLLSELCRELFGHIIDSAMGQPHSHYHFNCEMAGESVFLHLLRHLQENDMNIIKLLSCENNDLFLGFFKSNLERLIRIRYADRGAFDDAGVPEDYLVAHIAAAFAQTVQWWLSKGMKESPEVITEYFLAVTEPLMSNK